MKKKKEIYSCPIHLVEFFFFCTNLIKMISVARGCFYLSVALFMIMFSFNKSVIFCAKIKVFEMRLKLWSTTDGASYQMNKIEG